MRKDPFTPMRLAMALVILFSLKTMVSLENGLQLHSDATPLFSMGTESLASSQSSNADDWCKWALIHSDQSSYLTILKQTHGSSSFVFL